MAVISLTIEESSEQIISGIPKIISVSTNIPATIFYTLDGTEPDTYSNIYTSAIKTSFNSMRVVFKVFATNGTDSSSIITNTYQSNIVGDRLPHATVSDLGNSNNKYSLYPFGDNAPALNFAYGNPGNAGTTVNNSEIPLISNGFDGDGNPSVETSKPIESYELIYSDYDAQGHQGHGIGNLPSNTQVIGKTTPTEYTPESSDRADRIFNPKAMVIFQNAATEDDTDPVMINRQNFSLENPEIVKSGVLLYNTALDSPSTTGSFVKSYYNEREGTLTSYYYDNSVNRWIISKAPFENKNPQAGQLYHMVFPRERGAAGKVFPWVPWQRRIIF